jgi:hypothetical protein
MRNFVLCLFLASFAHAQQWTKTEYHDELHNKSGVKFVLAAKEQGGGIGVVCSDGKLQEAWLMIDKIADARVGDTVDVDYRRDNEAKAHRIRLTVSEDFRGVLLQRHGTQIGLGPGSQVGFEQLLYGPLGFGGGEWRKNKKTNNWARRVIVGVSAYADSDAVFTFDVPDPTPVREACGIH